jgi:hypothetical protein
MADAVTTPDTAASGPTAAVSAGGGAVSPPVTSARAPSSPAGGGSFRAGSMDVSSLGTTPAGVTPGRGIFREEMTIGEADAWRAGRDAAVAEIRRHADALHAASDVERKPDIRRALHAVADACEQVAPRREPTGLEYRGG